MLFENENELIHLYPDTNESDLQTLFKNIYKQVFGNIFLMESDCLLQAESLLRNRSISVREFVGIAAKSSLYRRYFFESASQNRFIENNFKHLLGRAPHDQSEVSKHIIIYNTQGYFAEIDSYINSTEYSHAFGEYTIPYMRATRTQLGFKNSNFNRIFILGVNNASADVSSSAKLVHALATNSSPKIISPKPFITSNLKSSAKVYRITVVQARIGPRIRQGKQEFRVSFDEMSKTIQRIHKSKGKILDISYVGMPESFTTGKLPGNPSTPPPRIQPSTPPSDAPVSPPSRQSPKKPYSS